MNQFTQTPRVIECLEGLHQARNDTNSSPETKAKECGDHVEKIHEIFRLDATAPDETTAIIECAAGMVLSDAEGAAALVEAHFALHAPPVARAVSDIDDPRPATILSALKKGGAVLTAGEICVLSGEGGIGKSALAGEIALAVASGANEVKGLFDIGMAYQGKPVLWLTYEEAPGELAARLKERTKPVFLNDDHEAMSTAAERIHVLDMRGGWPLFGPVDGFSSRPDKLTGWPPMQSALNQLEGLALIVVDPVLAAYVGEQNDAAPVREFLGALATLAREHKAGVLALAHSRKSARDRHSTGTTDHHYDPGQVSGSTAWHDGVRGVLTFAFDKESNERVLAVAKANMGPAYIKCEAAPIRKTDRGWIIGFKGNGGWDGKNPGASTPFD